MSAIVKYTRKDGSVFAYESTAKWDASKKQSRPIRKYLGKVDPESGAIIPSSGKRGRPLGSKNKPRANTRGDTQRGQSTGSKTVASAQDEELKTARQQVGALQAEIDSLRKRNTYLERVLKDVVSRLSEAVG